MKGHVADSVHVLHVDDDGDFLDMTAEFLQREDDRIHVETAADATAGMAGIDEGGVDCVVSDFDMPGQNGIEFLEQVRAHHPDLPFVLFTGKGSEEVAGEAISAGVTDYLQKGRGTEQYAVLANRIVNAVERARAERERTRHLDAIETAQEGIGILDEDGEFLYVNEEFADLYGYDPAALTGEQWELIFQEDDIPTIRDDVLPFVEETGYWHGTTTGLRADGSTFVEDHVLSRTEDGELICTVRDITDLREQEAHLDVLARRYEAIFENPMSLIVLLNPDGMILEINPTASNLGTAPLDEIVGEPLWDAPGWADADALGTDLEGWIERAANGEHVRFEADVPTTENERLTIDGLLYPIHDETGSVLELLLIGRDVTDTKERERTLRRERDRLEDFTRVVSHDLRTPLNVASVRLDLAQEECESGHLAPIGDAHQRIEKLLDDLLTLARTDTTLGTIEHVSLQEAASESWETVPVEGAAIGADTRYRLQADESRLKQLLENLFRNAIEHAGDDITVQLGGLPDGDGFYIEDDGDGIPPAERERVFEMGYSRAAEGTGLGLRIVSRIVDAHGWDIRITESDTGGARFEITDVTPASGETTPDE